jgi:DNA-binding beta-propeller fold protein YncE
MGVNKKRFFIAWIFVGGFLFMAWPAYCGEYYEFVSKWGSFGIENYSFNYPWGVSADSKGNVYVTDTYNHRIQKFKKIEVKKIVVPSHISHIYHLKGVHLT